MFPPFGYEFGLDRRNVLRATSKRVQLNKFPFPLCREDDDSDFDAEEEEDYTPVQKKSKTSAAPRSAGGAGKSTGRAPKAPSLAQQLGVLSRDQLVDVIATLVDQGAVERDAVLGALPAPDMSKGRDEIDALRRQASLHSGCYHNLRRKGHYSELGRAASKPT